MTATLASSLGEFCQVGAGFPTQCTYIQIRFISNVVFEGVRMEAWAGGLRRVERRRPH